ncbi:endonuclease/exonuclease/phosphatase family protein [Hyalangium gracile]|uniref:endonuclease/exonuclease/phosphatase family protein n=1 Tax=Hyalangium gracile TaxID=394092 RepID=UPI001CCA0E91|nr:endonuclease/exonuclease/phosphatase family protein [Hyalangium gracile]
MGDRVRIATFNLENFDEKPGSKPPLAERIALMRPQLLRVDADILCLQEVHGQMVDGHLELRALERLLHDTRYAGYHQVSTHVPGGTGPMTQRNLVILSRFEILEYAQHLNDLVPAPLYRMVTADPPEQNAAEIRWERPLLHARVRLPGGASLHIINLHLKSRIPTDIPNQKVNDFTWKSASAWAEGAFISMMRRVGQALEARRLVDQLFDADESALIAVCGDLNADSDEVPVEALRGDVENTSNPKLVRRVLVSCERSVPEPARYSLLHRGKGQMFDHILASRALLAAYQHTEIHNELLHDESIAFATDELYPESDHSPVIAEFQMMGA